MDNKLNCQLINILLDKDNQFVRHCPPRLARAVSYWYRKQLKDKE